MLLLSGHFWGPGSLPEALGELRLLTRLDVSGLPYLHPWLRDLDARRRHGLSVGSDRDPSRITLQVPADAARAGASPPGVSQGAARKSLEGRSGPRAACRRPLESRREQQQPV